MPAAKVCKRETYHRMSFLIDKFWHAKSTDAGSKERVRRFFITNKKSILVVLLLSLSLVWMMGDVILDPANIPGTDTYFHITLIDEARDRILAGQPIGPISESINGGRAYLYGTDSTYPQFGYWVAVIVALAVGSSELSFTLLMFAALLTAQLTFFLGFKSRFGVVPAAYGAVAFGYAPFLMTNVLPQGRFPAVLAVALLPLIMSAVLRILESPGKKWWAVGLIATAVSVAFHPMVFYMAAIGLAAIGAAYVAAVKTSLNRILLASSMIVLGVLVAWLMLPSGLNSLSLNNGAASTIVGSGGPGVRATTGGHAVIVPFSIRWNSFDVRLRSFNENYAGLGLALAGLTSLVFAWRKKVALFAVAAIFLYLLASGTATPLWNMIPLASVLEPRRFLFPAYLAVGLVIGSGVSVLIAQMHIVATRRVRLQTVFALVLIAALMAFDAIPMAGRIAPDERDLERLWVDTIADKSNGGRAFWQAYKDFSPYYFFSQKAGVETIGRMSDVDRAIRQGFPETALEQIALLDVRIVLTEQIVFEGLVDQLVAHGFTEDMKQDTQLLLTSDKPSVRVMTASRNVGLVGVAAELYWSRIIPNSIPIGNLSDAPTGLTDTLDAIVMSAYSAAEGSDIESLLIDYVNGGGTVIIGEPNRSGDDLFGVDGVRREVPAVLSVESASGPVQTQPFEINGRPFFGIFYDDAGETVLAGTDESGNEIPIIQKRSLGEGAIYWVCCNIGNHIVENPGEDFELAYTLRSFFENEIGGYGDIWPRPFGTELTVNGPSDFEFTYRSDEPTLAVISARPLSQRRVLVDGQEEAEILPYGPVFAIELPAGEHRVSVTTSANPVTPGALGLWVLAVATTVYLLRNLWLWLAIPPLPSVGLRYAIRRWISEPPFVREFSISAGVLRVCEPRTGRRFDVKAPDGKFRRFEPSGDEMLIALVFVEFSAPAGEGIEFDFDRLILSSAEGREFHATPPGELQSHDLMFPNLLHLTDIKYSLIGPIIKLAPSEVIRGYIAFEYPAAEEYPFVHGAFVNLR